MAKRKNTITEYRHYHLPMNFPVLLVNGSEWRISPVRSERLHFHNCLELGLCHSDSGIMEFEGRSYHFRAGDIVCVPRHISHTTYSDPGMESLWSYIYFDPEELFSNMFLHDKQILSAPQIYTPGYCYVIHKHDEEFLHSMVLAVIRELRAQPENYELAVRGLLMGICIELGRIQTMQPKQNREQADNASVITPVLDYIHDNYMHNFTIADLADICHLSETHFRRVFSTIMGYTPLDFVMYTRIDKACNLLRSTENSILSIAEQVGFHSISSFNRSFTKILDMSPRDWRKTIHNADRDAKEKQTILEFNGWMQPEKL